MYFDVKRNMHVIVLLGTIQPSSIAALWLIIIATLKRMQVYRLNQNTRATSAIIIIIADFLWWAKNCEIFMNLMIFLVWRCWWTTCSTSWKLFIQDFKVLFTVFHLCTVYYVPWLMDLECNFGASSISNCQSVIANHNETDWWKLAGSISSNGCETCEWTKKRKITFFIFGKYFILFKLFSGCLSTLVAPLKVICIELIRTNGDEVENHIFFFHRHFAFIIDTDLSSSGWDYTFPANPFRVKNMRWANENECNPQSKYKLQRPIIFLVLECSVDNRNWSKNPKKKIFWNNCVFLWQMEYPNYSTERFMVFFSVK